MDEPRAVRRRQRVADLNCDRQRLGQRQRALGDPRVERLAVEQLHHEIRGALVIADVVQRADVRMTEL